MHSKKIPDLNQIKSAVNDADRLEAVKKVRQFGIMQRDEFDKLAKQAAIMFNAPIALISLVEEKFDLIVSQEGFPRIIADTGRVDAQPSFCELTIAQKGPVMINDAANHPTLRLFPSVQYMGVRAHLGISLCYNGQAVGNICVIDLKPRQWTDDDVKALSNLAQKAMDQMNLQSKNQANLL
jgi:GAF domain-containing protein